MLVEIALFWIIPSLCTLSFMNTKYFINDKYCVGDWLGASGWSLVYPIFLLGYFWVIFGLDYPLSTKKKMNER